LDPGQDLPALHAVDLPDQQVDHLAGEHRLHVDLDLGLHGADLGDADLDVAGLGLRGLDLVLVVLGLRLGPGRHRAAHEQEGGAPQPEPLAHTLPVRLRHRNAPSWPLRRGAISLLAGTNAGLPGRVPEVEGERASYWT